MDDVLKNKIWNKASIVDGFDPDIIRKDCCGAWIVKSEFGNINSRYGWDIDNVYPKSKGGDDRLINLRPMQWENKRKKGDDFPVYNVIVRANGGENVYQTKQFKVNEELLAQLSTEYQL